MTATSLSSPAYHARLSGATEAGALEIFLGPGLHRRPHELVHWHVIRDDVPSTVPGDAERLQIAHLPLTSTLSECARQTTRAAATCQSVWCREDAIRMWFFGWDDFSSTNETGAIEGVSGPKVINRYRIACSRSRRDERAEVLALLDTWLSGDGIAKEYVRAGRSTVETNPRRRRAEPIITRHENKHKTFHSS